MKADFKTQKTHFSTASFYYIYLYKLNNKQDFIGYIANLCFCVVSRCFAYNFLIPQGVTKSQLLCCPVFLCVAKGHES